MKQYGDREQNETGTSWRVPGRGDRGTDLTIESLATALGVDCGQLRAVIDGDRGVDAELALRLSRHYGTSAKIWMDLQSQYSLKMSKRDLGERNEREVEPRVEESAEVVEAA